MTNNEMVLGIDIGGTTTAFGFVDRSGKRLAGGVILTEAQQPAEILVARLQAEISALQATLPPRLQLKGIGIGAPNANYRQGTVENPPNLNWGPSVNLVELFLRHYDLPVAITNDANAAALGELYFGGARYMKDFIVITLGTGLGSGIVVNGELLYGAGGFAGELGHTIVDPQGRQCACGKTGCLETYVSATGLCRTTLALLAERLDPSPLRDLSSRQISAKDVFLAARAGDAIGLVAFETTARILGMKLADAVAHTGPEAIFLSGGLANAGELLLTPTRRYLEEYLFIAYQGRVRLLLSEITEGGSAVIGAAALIWNELERVE
ncbi:MAG: glucokinase [Deltaproteobacteria bacterium HGW-Deltaproteobacteria-4]|nr:MAG: glucokinase [Deltaproteobacteria bacterium HGW-Deltaproteobacteria-4]